MQTVTTQHTDRFSIMRIPNAQADVVRFKITVDLFSEKTIEHPSLLDQYAELLLSGTKKYTRDQITDELDAMGTELDIDRDAPAQITISVTSLSSNLERTLALLHAICTESTFAQKELTRVQRKLGHQYRDDLDTARKRARALFSRTLYSKKHPHYTADVPIKQKDLKKIGRSDIKKLHQLFLSRLWKISVASDTTSTETILRFCSRTHTKEISTTAPSFTQAKIREAKTSYITLPSKANVDICIGNILPYTQADSEFLPFVFGYNVLAKPGSFRGRLMSTVREKEGLTYMIYGRIQGATKETYGSWYIDTFFTPHDLEKGLAATKREIRTILKEGITQNELKEFKTLLYNLFRITHESSARSLSLYHNALLSGNSAEEIRTNYERITGFTKKEVNEALRGALSAERLVITGAGPVE